MAVGSTPPKSRRSQASPTPSGGAPGAPLNGAGSKPAAGPRPGGSGLDPQGIYGTRSAYRVRMARRRRATQSIVVLSGIIGLVVAVMLYLRVPHVPSIGSVWQDNLMTS